MRRVWGDRRRLVAVAVAAAAALACAFPLVTASAAQAGEGRAAVPTAVAQAAGPLGRAASAAPPETMPPTEAWILVDADTGAVLQSHDDRTPLPPASLTKVITALAASNLAPDASVTITSPAAAEPLDDLGVRTGQVWTADELFHAMLIYSANDAAMALAQETALTEQAAGASASIESVLGQTAQDLGLQDHPVLQDPAGLDGTEGVDGGNRVSARDLAIAGRALLDDPYLASIVALKTYKFQSPTGGHVTLVSHNLSFLSSYPGAVGIKTGYTNLAGTCVMAAARRDGRTMLAVVLHSANPTVAASQLLDSGFATPVVSESPSGQLPPVDLAALRPTAAVGVSIGAQADQSPAGPSPTTAPVAQADIAAAGTHQPKSFGMLTLDGIVALLLVLATVARLRSEQRRRLAVAPNLWFVDSAPLSAGGKPGVRVGADGSAEAATSALGEAPSALWEADPSAEAAPSALGES